MIIGFRILPRRHGVSPDLVASFKALPVANVNDSMHRLRAYHASGSLAGPALTVRSRPGDNLMLHKAIDMAHPGDTIVVDAGGDLT
jgi:regulator of RNase E activity RraA